MKITKPINPELLLEELEVLGTVYIDAEGERVTKVNLTRTSEGYELTGVSEDDAAKIVEAHEHTTPAKSENEAQNKTKLREKVLKKLKITEEELRELLDK